MLPCCHVAHQCRNAPPTSPTDNGFRYHLPASTSTRNLDAHGPSPGCLFARPPRKCGGSLLLLNKERNWVIARLSPKSMCRVTMVPPNISTCIQRS
ncbi:hypothetical protein BKA66DRAFT_303856 [Pyrenochaeta sp. MPI-SDFR-AT-0127]|nr:hypothetical protein BKA66DRAFT_303856 [Pyrenochaeta sp. MPI-SDFR-AT-0127]